MPNWSGLFRKGGTMGGGKRIKWRLWVTIRYAFMTVSAESFFSLFLTNVFIFFGNMFTRKILITQSCSVKKSIWWDDKRILTTGTRPSNRGESIKSLA